MYIKSPEEAEELVEALAKKWNSETQFLLDRGWAKTDKKWEKSGFTAEVWTHPDGKEYAHISSLIGIWTRAYDVAITDYIYELGWQPILSRTEFAAKIKRHTWQRFIHPDSGQVYSWDEACMLVNEFDNDDTACPEERLSILTRRLRTILKEHKLHKNNFILLFMQMLKDKEISESNSLHHLVQVFETEADWKTWCKEHNLEKPEQWKQWAKDNGYA
jgi:hypothetical protein